MAFMFVRVIFIFNLYKHLASWRTLHGYRKLAENKMRHGFLLHLRYGLQKKPIMTFTLIFVTLVLSFACILQIFERPYYYTVYWSKTQ